MSNHNLSYSLNDVFILLNEMEVFNNINEEKRKLFIEKFIELIDLNDCNENEVFSNGVAREICYCPYCNSFDVVFTKDEDGNICDSCCGISEVIDEQ